MSEAAALGYIYCVMKSDSSLSADEVKIGSEINQLLGQTLPSHSFQKELELIANYSDLQTAASDAKTSTANAAAQSSVTPGAKGLPNTDPMPAAPVAMGRQRSLDEKEYQILQMMEAIGEDKVTCTFYLESMDYNLEAAMDLYKSNLK
eukprot:gene38466-46753_t